MNKKYLIIFPIALAVLEAGTYLGNDAYLPALPNLMHDMHINQQFAQYTLISWFLGSASVQLFIGPLADFYGRRPIVLWGAAIFILTSLTCAYPDQYWLLLIARFLQGTAACTTIVGGYATVHEAFDSHKSVRVIALMGATTASPSFTASAPPGQKSFCTSMTIKAFMLSGLPYEQTLGRFDQG